MSKKAAIIIGVIVLVLGGMIAWAVVQANMSAKKYDTYDLYSYIEGNDDNGHIADHVKGNKDAKVLIFEYADYQCSGCASNVASVNKLVEKYGDKIGIVFRTYVLSYHTNGKAADYAAEAAGLQGYWKEYGEKLFANQNDWFYSDASQRTTQFEQYFTEVTGGKGNLDQFRSDVNSANVAAKFDFDKKLSERLGTIEYTPAFYMDGKFIDWANNSQSSGSDIVKNTEKKNFVDFMSELIDKKLAEQK